MDVSDLVDKWDDEVDAWLELALELLEAVDHGRVLLSDDHHKSVVGHCACDSLADVPAFAEERSPCYLIHCNH